MKYSTTRLITLLSWACLDAANMACGRARHSVRAASGKNWSNLSSLRTGGGAHGVRRPTVLAGILMLFGAQLCSAQAPPAGAAPAEPTGLAGDIVTARQKNDALVRQYSWEC